MAVNSGLGQPEVEAELLKRDQLPNDNYRANAAFRVALKKVSAGLPPGVLSYWSPEPMLPWWWSYSPTRYRRLKTKSFGLWQ
jgi:hypothetical protein